MTHDDRVTENETEFNLSWGWAVRRRTRHRAALLLAGLAGVGCSEATVQSDRLTVGDTTIVRSVTPLVPDTLEPREVVRIGSLDGPMEYAFSNIFDFAVGADGSVYIHDRDDGIRRYDADGTFQGYLAREGEGPAEVGYIRAMDASPDGTRLAAIDLTNGRVAIFDLGGSDEPTLVRRPNLRPRYGDGGVKFLTDGSVWMGVYPRPREVGGTQHPHLAYLRVTDTQSPADTIYTPSWAGDVCTILSERTTQAGFWEDRRAPFLPKAMWALGSDGTMALGCPATYSLDVIAVDGSVLRIERPDWTPLLMSDSERDGMARQSGMWPPPRERPAYARIMLTDDGRVWVWPSQPNQLVELSPEAAEMLGRRQGWRLPETGFFDVYTPTGEWLATVRLPESARFSGFPTSPKVVIRGDTIWAVEEGDLDEQSLVRYHVDGLSQRAP